MSVLRLSLAAVAIASLLTAAALNASHRKEEPRSTAARCALLALGLLLVASSAFGQAPAPYAAQLVYDRPSALAACPDEYYFRNFVAARLEGGDPFAAGGPTRRITVKLSRPKGEFVAVLAMFDDRAGKRLGGEELADADCGSLVQNSGRAVVEWLGLSRSVARTPPPSLGPEPAPAPAPVSPPAKPELGPRTPTTPAPVEAPKAGVFTGKAGIARATLYGLTAGTLAAGAMLAVTASSRGNGAAQTLGSLVQKAGGSPCYQSPPMLARSCHQIGVLVQQHDDFSHASDGAFVAAGVLALTATASIWLARTPGAPAVQVSPAAPGSLAGITMQGSSRLIHRHRGPEAFRPLFSAESSAISTKIE